MHHEDIIRQDFRKNHARLHGVVAPEQVVHMQRAYEAMGGKSFHADRTLINYSLLHDGSVEFHCSNAGSGEELAAAVNAFLLKMGREGVTVCKTQYDNPAVTQLMRHSRYPVSVQQINGGPDKTFEATFTLKG